MSTSVCQVYGQVGNGKCGYCKTTNDTKGSWGMWAYQLTVHDYQDLIDRGWRRCGYYCYKPIMDKTCCPAYTIRCNAIDFRPSRSHRCLLKYLATFMNTGRRSNSNRKKVATDTPPRVTVDSKGDGQGQVAKGGPEEMKPRITGSGDASQRETKPGSKARARRWAAKLARMQARCDKEGCSMDILLKEHAKRRSQRLAKNKGKTVEDLLGLVKPTEAKHFIEMRLVRSSPISPEMKASLDLEFNLYKRYQTRVHGDNPEELNMEGFTNFLVDSPLVSGTSPTSSANPDRTCAASSCTPQLGSYHQQYWLDGKRLVAVGVVDLLPRCLSSVYLFYDPDFDFLSLGTYSALREIAYVRELSRHLPDLTYYYMGFYIHTCPKMRYKGLFRPSFLACPETYQWQPIDQCRPRLDVSKYSRLSPETQQDANAVDKTGRDLDASIVVQWNKKRATLDKMKGKINATKIAQLREWARLVGRECLARIEVIL